MQASQRLDRFGAEVFASLNNKLGSVEKVGVEPHPKRVGPAS